jgi:hypothetical protein
MATAFDEDAYQARVNQIPGYESPYGNKPSVPRKDNFFQDSELGRNLYNASMALPGVGGIGKVAATGGLISRGVNAGAAAANTASKSMVALAGIPTSTNQPSGAQATPPKATPPQTTPPAAPPTSAAAPTGQQVPGLSGVYKHGEGQYSDNAQGMGLPQNLGQPSAQNMQAANNLAGQEQKRSMMSVMREQQEQQQMQQPRGFAAPQIQHSGNSSTSKDELRRLRWAAESAMENAPRKKYAMQDPAVMAYQAALQGDTAARYGGQAALEAKTNDTNAGLQREQMQQDGANQRERPRTMMDAMRLDMERQTQGFANRAAAQQEQLRNTVLDEQATPEQRNTAQRNLAALTGRTSTENLSNNFMRRKAPVLNEQGIPTGEQREEIIDLRSGRPLEAPSIPPGAIAELRRNPQAAGQFDELFGPGAASQYLR